MDYQELVRRIASRDKGIYTSAKEDDNRCPVCGGTGREWVIEYSENGEKYNAVRKCTACKGNHDQIVRERKSLADIPENRTIEAFDWNIYPGFNIELQRKQVSDFIEHFTEFETAGKGLFITSRTRGSGKSFLATCIGGELINCYEASTVFINESELLNTASQKREDGSDPLDKILSCRILILDDLGQKLTGRDFLTDVLFRIIDKRAETNRIMIVTSNYPIFDLDLDDRLVDRLNRITYTINLPEYCVRAIEANREKKALLQKLGLNWGIK